MKRFSLPELSVSSNVATVAFSGKLYTVRKIVYVWSATNKKNYSGNSESTLYNILKLLFLYGSVVKPSEIGTFDNFFVPT